MFYLFARPNLLYLFDRLGDNLLADFLARNLNSVLICDTVRNLFLTGFAFLNQLLLTTCKAFVDFFLALVRNFLAYFNNILRGAYE